MRVRFWGVRGSVPFSVPAAAGVGCNTSCVEVRDDRTGAHLILDAGTGLFGLSGALSGPPRPIPIVLSHYHWDHTQGLPFFMPLFAPGWTPEVYAPELGTSPDAWLPTIFEPPNYPVPFPVLPNRPTLHRVAGEPFEAGGFRLSVQPLTHPGGAFAYRVHGDTGDLCYVTDHEFGRPDVDEALAQFCDGCAALISDAHFTPDEMPKFAGWGHGDWRTVARFARRVGAGRVFLFHHKPGRTDAEVDQIVVEARREFPATDAAREGLAFDI